MTSQEQFIDEFLRNTEPWRFCSEQMRQELVSAFRPLKYAVGDVIVSRKSPPQNFYVVAQGRVRSLGFLPEEKEPVSLELLSPGHSFGWPGLATGTASETIVTSHETVCLTLSAQVYYGFLDREPVLQKAYVARPALVEVFDILVCEFARRADNLAEVRDKAVALLPETAVKFFPMNGNGASEFSPDFLWFISAGPAGQRGTRWTREQAASRTNAGPTRIIGIPSGSLTNRAPEPPAAFAEVAMAGRASQAEEEYPEVRGEGELEGAVACFEMACRYLDRPFRPHVLRRVLSNQLERVALLSLKHCGAVAELAGLDAHWAVVAEDAIDHLEPPGLIRFENELVVFYRMGESVVLGSPRNGLRRIARKDFRPDGSADRYEVLFLKPGSAPLAQEPFSLRWFWPAIQQHRRVLIEVLVASFFVQLFTLANPLLTQVIIDKVLVQNSADTLNVLGVLLLVVAFFAALLGGLRTYLFVDTTNRIDLSLGSTIINRLYRLTLNYFQRRPVGEIATRLNELENIRQFLTGTALTVVLDGIFSVIYLAVMVAYSIPLTIAALATVPVLGALTFFVAPLLRKQLRFRAQRYSETQSYLVETLSGVQTIKAQNLELHARWSWQERYSRFVSAGFRTVLTSTSVNAVTNFLMRLSDLAVLWFGAYLVIARKLSLGQLIAFRIISGYVASPLLRLVQSWQQFQEVGLSIERLGDILDAPAEQPETEAQNIPMPSIEGAVSFDRVSFSYVSGGRPQLRDLQFEVPAGAFVGVVGQSGSGKSTLLKLLPRLYSPDSGRIFIDQYDIGKVELYSLRRQIGMVLQDSLLFDGTIQENIGLADPDAPPEKIVAAAKVAVAHDFIMGLSEGYNTRVGEGGRSLSGGQRQRVAIARVVLQQPRLLVLDEATSAVDFPAERQICRNLAEAFKGRSVFFVTHRLRSVQGADVILFLEDGVIAERGSHDELMALRGRYYSLFQQQDLPI